MAASHGPVFVSLLDLLESATSPRRVRATETVESTG
jgi:ketosteroid isomerase-like protein